VGSRVDSMAPTDLRTSDLQDPEPPDLRSARLQLEMGYSMLLSVQGSMHITKRSTMGALFGLLAGLVGSQQLLTSYQYALLGSRLLVLVVVPSLHL